VRVTQEQSVVGATLAVTGVRFQELEGNRVAPGGRCEYEPGSPRGNPECYRRMWRTMPAIDGRGPPAATIVFSTAVNYMNIREFIEVL
jgi:hypothetical protein